MSKWLSTQEVAAQFEIDINTVTRLVREKGLPGYKVGKAYRFDATELDAWVRQQDQPSRPSVETDWVAVQLAKFTVEDLRRAGEVLISLSRTLQTAGGR